MSLNRKLRMALIGGGPGAFIGDVHSKAARMDGKIELVAGAFSSDPAKSQAAGRAYLVDRQRVYGSYEELIEKEKKLPEGERVDFVAITTPNHLHFPIAKECLKAGFHVMCEKPMTFTVKEAKALRDIVRKSGALFGLMHNYTGYPMVKLARDIIRQGDLGELRKIVVQYPQGWLTDPQEKSGSKQAGWRTDPARSGAAGAIGDIGTHAENLSEYLTGLKITELCADISTFVKGRPLDDDGNCLVHFEQGVKGVLHVSQIANGEENDLAIWIYGSKKGLEWHQEQPNYLSIKDYKGPVHVWRRGNPYIGEKSPAAGRASRLPFGHPEGFIEAFANVYVNFADTLGARLAGEKPDPLMLDFPDVDDGVRGMLFIETVLDSARSAKKWTKMHS
jgi:predicted dehydrogenase